MMNENKFKLSNYIIPSIISMVLVGTYTNIDGLFIGNVLGDNGLAAINFAWPIVAFITSLGTGIGIGGSVVLNTLRGKNDHEGAEEVKNTLINILFFVGILASIVFALLCKPILQLCGASGVVLTYSLEYSYIVGLGAIFQILGSGAVALLRNEKKTYLSMICCIVGLIVHVVLDILLCDKYAMKGVAISTVVSQAVIMILCFFGIKFDIKKRIEKKYIKEILLCSTSPFGINFVPSMVLLFTNYFAQSVGGVPAVSAYTVMSYAVYTYDYVFQGVCDGVQPVISYSHGACDLKEKNRALKVSAIILGIFTLIFIALTPFMNFVLPDLFKVSGTAKNMMITGFWLYALSYPFKAFVKYMGSYYYAIGKTKLSNLLIYTDPLLFTPLYLIALPLFMGINGIWLTLGLSQISVTIISIVIIIIDKVKNKKFNKEEKTV